MASLTNLRLSAKPTFHFQINPQRRSPRNLSFPLVFRDLTKSTPLTFPVVNASSSSPSPSNPKPSLLKKTFITLTVAAAIFAVSPFRFHFSYKMTPVTTVEEATLEKHLEVKSNDVEALLSLTEIKFESEKYDQAIEILNRLIEIDPNELKWYVMKARILSYNSQRELAVEAFEEILLKEPDRIDAYHYLVMEYYDSKPKLVELEERIKKVIERFKKINKKAKEVRGLKLLTAQIKVIEGNTSEAMRICEEVVKDDPKDFRVYMFQGLVYSMMKKGDEAMKQFEVGTSLIPENHPFLVKYQRTRI